jgi:acylglycerol lipase
VYAEAAVDPLIYHGKVRLQTAVSLNAATEEIAARLNTVEVCMQLRAKVAHPDTSQVPFLCLHGSADVVTDPAISQSLYNAAPSKDKTLKMMEGLHANWCPHRLSPAGMFHALTAEPDGGAKLVLDEILGWLNVRIPTAHVPQLAQQEHVAHV